MADKASDLVHPEVEDDVNSSCSPVDAALSLSSLGDINEFSSAPCSRQRAIAPRCSVRSEDAQAGGVTTFASNSSEKRPRPPSQHVRQWRNGTSQPERALTA